MGDEAQKAKAHEEGLRGDLRAYSKLKNVNASEEMSAFMDLLVDTAAKKMLWTFLGDNVKSWDDFLKVRGEIVAYLYPIQEVRGADAMAKTIREQLDLYYPKAK